MQELKLRPLELSDLDAIFNQISDPESVYMAAFTHEDPDDRIAFNSYMEKKYGYN